MTNKFNPSEISNYVKLQCNRYLWLVLNPEKQNKKGIYPNPGHDLAFLLHQGELFETKVIYHYLEMLSDDWNVTNVFRNSSFYPVNWPRVRKTIEKGKKQVFVQPKIIVNAETLRKIGLIHFSPHFFQELIPDLIVYDGSKNTLRIIDLKLARKAELSHRLQVTLYAILLSEMEEFKKLDSKIILSIWFRGIDYPGEEFEIAPYREFISSFLVKNVNSVINEELDDVLWYLRPNCRKACKFYTNCLDEANKRNTFHKVAYIPEDQLEIIQHGSKSKIIDIINSNQQNLLSNETITRLEVNFKGEIVQINNDLYIPELINELYITTIVDPIEDRICGIGIARKNDAGYDIETKVFNWKKGSINVLKHLLMLLSSLDVDLTEKVIHLFIANYGDIQFISSLLDENLKVSELYSIPTDELFKFIASVINKINPKTGFTFSILDQILRDHFVFPLPIDYDTEDVARIISRIYPELIADYDSNLLNGDALDLRTISRSINDNEEEEKIRNQLKRQLISRMIIVDFLRCQNLVQSKSFLSTTFNDPKNDLSISIPSTDYNWKIFAQEFLSYAIGLIKHKVSLRRPAILRHSEGRSINNLVYLLYNKPNYYFYSTDFSGKFREGSWYLLTILKENPDVLCGNNPSNSAKIELKLIKPWKYGIIGEWLDVLLFHSWQMIPFLGKNIIFCLDEIKSNENFLKLQRVSVLLKKKPDLSINAFRKLTEITDGPISKSEIIELERWFTSVKGNMNSCQLMGWSSALTKSLTLVKGPPGTGKSNVAKWIAASYVKFFTDNAVKQGYSGNVLFLGATNRVIDNLLNMTAECLLNIVNTSKDKFKLFKFKGTSDPRLNSIVTYESSKTRIRDVLTDHSKITIVGSTVYGLIDLFSVGQVISPKTDYLFDLIVIDEATQMSPLHGLFAATLLNQKKSSIVILGDDKQLKPVGNVINSNQKLDSLYSFIYKSIKDEIMLTKNYRMNEEITSFPSFAFYNQQLEPVNSTSKLDHGNCSCNEDELANLLLLQSSTVLISYEGSKISNRRDFEPHLITKILDICVNHYVESMIENPDQRIAIISPYRKNVQKIKKELRKLPESSLISKSRFQELIDTIDSFQGQEREIIILSLGQGYGHPGLWNSEFILNPERFNVAVTRSKLQLILVFDQDLLQSIPRTIDACEASYLLFIYLYLQKRKETFFYDFNEEEVKLDFFLRK